MVRSLWGEQETEWKATKKKRKTPKKKHEKEKGLWNQQEPKWYVSHTEISQKPKKNPDLHSEWDYGQRI